MRIRHTIVRAPLRVSNGGLGMWFLFRAFSQLPYVIDQLLFAAFVTLTVSAALFGLDLLCDVATRTDKNQDARPDFEAPQNR